MPVKKLPIAPAFPKVPKMPKSMGVAADTLYDVRQARLAAEKYAAEIKALETALTNHIIDNLDKREDSGAAGTRYRVQIKRDRKYRVNPEAWERFYAWVAKKNRFDLLQKRLSDTAVAEVMTNMPAKQRPPGVEPFDALKLSLTKV